MWTVFLIFCNSWITTRVALTQAKGKSISYFRDISLMHASRTLRWSQIPDMWPRCVEAFEQPWCALMSEQNGSRIMRALLEVALSKQWGPYFRQFSCPSAKPSRDGFGHSRIL